MIELANIYEYKNGKKKIVFFELGIYDLLKEKLGFRYSKIKGKGYYLKENNGVFEIVGFHHLGLAFKEFIKKEFYNLDISKQIDYISFMNEFYKRRPIRDGNYARDYLSEDFQLSESNLHLILLKIDVDYKYKEEIKEMHNFFNNESFIKNNDTFLNLTKDSSLYYKKILENEYLVITEYLKTKQVVYDLFKIQTESEKDFFKGNIKNEIPIRFGFNLSRDLDIYLKEMNKA